MSKSNFNIWNWLGQRFWESRQFYSAYIALFISISNWITIQYKLVLEQIPGLNDIFVNLWIFVSVSITLFLIISILGGHYIHRKRQFRIEQVLAVEENPYRYMAVPGKERDLMIPVIKLQLETLEELLKQNNLLTDEKKIKFKHHKEALDQLHQGKSFGGFSRREKKI